MDQYLPNCITQCWIVPVWIYNWSPLPLNQSGYRVQCQMHIYNFSRSIVPYQTLGNRFWKSELNFSMKNKQKCNSSSRKGFTWIDPPCWHNLAKKELTNYHVASGIVRIQNLMCTLTQFFPILILTTPAKRWQTISPLPHFLTSVNACGFWC